MPPHPAKADSPDFMWVHFIRLLSIIAVVWVHSTAEIFFYGAKFGSTEWWIADIYDSVARICVPLLFMISGFLLLGKSEPVPVFLKKRAMKLVIPLLAWSAIYFAWIYFQEYHHPSHASSMAFDAMQKVREHSLFKAISVLWSPMYYHLWFLYALLGLYLVTPLLRVLVQNATPFLLRYFIVLSLIGTVVLPGLQYAYGGHIIIDLNMVSGSILHFMLGYLLGRITITKRLAWGMALLAVCAAAFTTTGIYFATANNGGVLKEDLWWNAAPNVVVMAVAAFIFLRYVGEQCAFLNRGSVARAVRHLSAAGFGIYLVHVLFLYTFAEGMFGFTLTAMSGHPAVFVPILVAATFFASYAVVYLLQKSPLRWLVP